MEFDWFMGWFVGPKFLLCDGFGWVGLKKLDLRTTLALSATFFSLSPTCQIYYAKDYYL